MISREFKLYLNAGTGIAPVINANQFDEGEEWIFTLLESDGTVYTPSTGSIIGLKSDGTTVLDAGTVNAEGQVVITETVQMTASSGKNVYELLIDGDSHGTANFIVFVEPRPGDIEHPSETELSLFEETIQAAGNVQQFQADIAALQSGLATTNANLTSEANTRASADATLQSAISTEASTRSTQDAVLQAEIDQIIAPSGEAPSAAEVQNARIGVDGTTYDTLGNAIREQVGDLKNALSTLFVDENISETTGYYINTNVNIGATVDETPVSNSSYSYAIIPCNANDVFTLTGTGGNNSRLWAFMDSDGKLLSKADANKTETNLELMATADGKLIVNTYNPNAKSISKKVSTVSQAVKEDEYLHASLMRELNVTSKVNKGYYIKTDLNVGDVCDIDSPVSNTSFGYLVYPCVKGDKITLTCYSGSAARAWAILDKDKKVLSVAATSVVLSDLTKTADAEGYFVINVNLAKDYSVKHKYISTNESLNALDADLANIKLPNIVLPSTLYGVVGRQFDLYKDNALIYGSVDSVADVKFGFFTTNMGGIVNILETRKKYQATPTGTVNGTPQFSLYRNSIKTRDVFKNVNVRVSDPSVLNGLTRNIVIIGDSKVAGGRLPQVFKYLCEQAGMTVGDLLGSIYNSNMDVRHEGRAGWASSDYFTASYGGVSNAFYNNGTFDFSYWMTQQGYSSMDYVFINLGTNDYSRAGNLNSLAYIRTFIDNINAMITSIHAYDSNIKIVIGLTEGVCTYKWSSNYDEYLYNLNTRARLLNQACIDEWDNAASRTNKIWLCPIYLSMDMEEDYVTSEIALSEWDAYFETGKKQLNVTDTMHQNSVGYAKNATYMFSLLTYIESMT